MKKATLKSMRARAAVSAETWPELYAGIVGTFPHDFEAVESFQKYGANWSYRGGWVRVQGRALYVVTTFGQVEPVTVKGV